VAVACGSFLSPGQHDANRLRSRAASRESRHGRRRPFKPRGTGQPARFQRHNNPSRWPASPSDHPTAHRERPRVNAKSSTAPSARTPRERGGMSVNGSFFDRWLRWLFDEHQVHRF